MLRVNFNQTVLCAICLLGTNLALVRPSLILVSYHCFHTNKISPSAVFAIYFDPSDILQSATRTSITFPKPLTYALGMILMPTEKLGSGSWFQTNSTRLVTYL